MSPIEQMSDDPQPAEALRALLARKSLADARQRGATARLLGLTESDVLALQHLAWAGALTPSRLGAQLRLTSGGTTALVQRLARLGYVAREPHPQDRRSTLLRLTPEAERDAGELYAPLVRDLDAAASALDPGEREAVAAYLARIADLAEERAGELARAADAERPRIPRVPVPGLWA
jgi:DNA-binding MarR family transcriptional regulator